VHVAAGSAVACVFAILLERCYSLLLHSCQGTAKTMTPEGRSRDSVVAGTAITNLSFQSLFSRGAEGNCIYRPVVLRKF